jgi:hypothetical protein
LGKIFTRGGISFGKGKNILKVRKKFQTSKVLEKISFLSFWPKARDS